MDKQILIDVITRSAKTFAQAFLATWAVSGYQFTQPVLVAAASAAISAVWNVVLAKSK